MSRTFNAPRRGFSAVVAGAMVLALTALAALGLATQADAAFSLGKCGGSAVLGRGASFARDAHQKVFIPRFQNSYCFGSSASVTYDAAGSGAGRTAVKVRNDTPRFGMTDEPPSVLEVEQMNAGTGSNPPASDTEPNDNGKVHVVPAAVGTVAPLVNFPNGCDPTQITDDSLRTISQAEITTTPAKAGLLRVRFPKEMFEKVWAGEAGSKNWDDVFTDLEGDAACEKPIIRVVRFDESGTSFAFKDELNALNPARDWLTDYSFVAPGLTRNWPNAAAFGLREDCPKIESPVGSGTMVFPSGPGADSTEPTSAGPDQLTSACKNGNGELVTKLINTDGSIGYSDVSTARTASPTLAVDQTLTTPPDKYWTQLQDGATPPVWQEPTQDPNGYRKDGTPGANCAHATFQNVPANTFGDWSKVSGVDSPGAFAVCTMTYGLVFDDNADVWGNDAQEQAEARTVKDYWENALSDSAQAQLILRDYSELPADILAIARAGISAVGWEKGSGGGGGGGGGTEVVDPKPPVTDGGPTPPAKPSNAFSLLKKSISSKTGGATVSVKLPGAGTLELVGTAKKGKKTIKVGRTVLKASKAGTFDLVLKPSAAAKAILKVKGKLAVKLALTFLPVGGDEKDSLSSLTLKLRNGKRN